MAAPHIQLLEYLPSEDWRYHKIHTWFLSLFPLQFVTLCPEISPLLNLHSLLLLPECEEFRFSLTSSWILSVKVFNPSVSTSSWIPNASDNVCNRVSSNIDKDLQKGPVQPWYLYWKSFQTIPHWVYIWVDSGIYVYKEQKTKQTTVFAKSQVEEWGTVSGHEFILRNTGVKLIN